MDALLAHWRGLLRQDLDLAPAWARVLDDPFLGAYALRFLFARAVLANFRPPPSPSPSPPSSAPPLQVSAPLIFSPSRRRKAESVPGLTRPPPRLVDAAGRSAAAAAGVLPGVPREARPGAGADQGVNPAHRPEPRARGLLRGRLRRRLIAADVNADGDVKQGGDGARGQRSGETPGPRAGTPPEAALTPCICPPSPEARCPRCRPPPAHFFIFLVPRWAATMGEPAGGLRGWRAGALGLALLALAGGAGTRAQTGAPPSPRGGPRASPPGAAQRRVTSPPTTTRWWWGSCSPLLRPAEAPAPARGPPTSPPRSPEPLLPRPPPPTPRPLAVPLQGASSGEPPPATRHRPRRLRPARGGPEPRAAAGTPTD